MVAEKILTELPDIETLRRLTQSLAVLEAILCPRPELRYYAFDADWGAGEMLASMDNGAGDHYFILFNSAGAVIKGFDHESAMSPHAGDGTTIWPGVLDELPTEFRAFPDEPAFMIEDTTFCLWRRRADTRWHTGRVNYPGGDADADGSAWMLPISKMNVDDYCEWARDYHGEKVDAESVRAIYAHQPLTEELVRRLNPQLSLIDVTVDAARIHYPTSSDAEN